MTEEAADGSKQVKTEFQYDPFGHPTRKTIEDEREDLEDRIRTWEYLHDLDGQIWYLEDPQNNKYHYEYDSLGNLVSVKQNDKLTTVYRYNALSWKLAEEYKLDKKTESYTYTATGNVATFTDKAGNIHLYDYTPFYEVSAETVYNRSGSKVLERNYDYEDTNGLLKRETSGEHEITYDYGLYRRMTAYHVKHPDTSRKLTYYLQYQEGADLNEYNINDLDDLVDSITYSDDKKVEYRYDSLGRISQVSGSLTGTIAYQYLTNQSGEQTTVTYPNGNGFTQSRNPFGEIVKTYHGDGWKEESSYDGFGNITRVERGNEEWNYEYDQIDRIIKERSSASPDESSYTYDDLGNRKEVVLAKYPLPEKNRSYSYNEWNQLTQVKEDGETTRYSYYPNGLRSTKKDDDGTTQYVYYNGHVIEELDGSGNIKAQNVYGASLLFRKDHTTGQSGYYLPNSHGDVMKVVDAKTNKVLNRYDYDIWGNLKPDSVKEEMNNPFRYAGEMYDQETGMYYLRARYYDPTMGRFISEDTYKGQIVNPLR